jgi:hypothetical protein
MRRLRLVKEGGELKLLHVRTHRDCFFLRPDPAGQVNGLVLGVLGKAQAKENVQIHAVTTLPHEVRIMTRFNDTPQMKSFMHFFDGNLSKILGERPDVRQRGGSFWRDRYRHVDVSDVDEADQVAALKEVLALPCTEGFVDRPADWPGVHSSGVLTQGAQQLRGAWHSENGTEDVVVRLSPLPCWVTRSTSERRGLVRKLVREIERESALARRRTGRASLGAAAVLALDPREGPYDVPRWETPWFLSLDTATREQMAAAYLDIVKRYRRAADSLWQVEPPIPFPPGTFPPPLPLTDGLTGGHERDGPGS